MQKLTAHEFPRRKIISSDFEFKIPEYQRPYRWGTDQALQLLDDWTIQVLELASWTPAIIEKRQQELTAVLAKEWELI